MNVRNIKLRNKMYLFQGSLFKDPSLLVLFLLFLPACTQKKDGSCVIGSKTYTFYDEQRDNRLLTVELWYPTDIKSLDDPYLPDLVWQHPPIARNASLSSKKQKYPLILYSHGYLGDRLEPWLPKFLAQHSFITATVDHYGNTWFNKIEKWSRRPWHRALDIRFILETILQDPFLKEKIDTDRIGFAGFSQGGWTGLLLAGAGIDLPYTYDKYGPVKILDAYADCQEEDLSQYWPNDRIKAFFLLAPGVGEDMQLLTTTFHMIKKPVFIVTGSDDDIVIPEKNAFYYKKHITNAQLYVIPQAGHWQFLSVPTPFGIKELTKLQKLELITDPPGIDRAALHAQIGAQAVKFFNENL